MTSPNNDTPATEPPATRTEATTPADVHLPGRSIPDVFADPEHDLWLVPDVQASPPDVHQAAEPGASKTKRGWPIETPTWQGVEI